MNEPVQVGDRVELVALNDPWSSLAPGRKGTVRIIDDLGTIHVQWDGGPSLGLVVEDGDAYRVLGESPKE